MKKLLIINACINLKTSRTFSLCRALTGRLLEKEQYEITELVLENEDLPCLNSSTLRQREALRVDGAFDDATFKYARLLADADLIIVAAPYWDLSFPASLKCFFEAASVNGIAFRYSEGGVPIGMCRASKLYYITTSGGPIGDLNFGYDYVKGLCPLYGIAETGFISAQNLDIIGADVDGILRQAREKIEL